MVDIRHRVGVYAKPEELHALFTDADGVTRWWTEDVRTQDGTMAFHFGGDVPGAVAEVTENTPNRIVWRVVDGGAAHEWVGTDIIFEIKDGAEGETVLLFTHQGWREPVEFMHHCSTKWAYFLLSVKAGLEGGKYTPYPGDMALGSWR